MDLILLTKVMSLVVVALTIFLGGYAFGVLVGSCKTPRIKPCGIGDKVRVIPAFFDAVNGEKDFDADTVFNILDVAHYSFGKTYKIGTNGIRTELSRLWLERI